MLLLSFTDQQLRSSLFRCAHHEHESGLDAEKTCDQNVRHLLQAGIEERDGIIVELATVGDLAFQFRNPFLEF